MQLRKYAWPAIIVLLSLMAIWIVVRAQNAPVIMGHDDLILYQRDKARIQLIQTQNQRLFDEFNQLTQKWCATAKLALSTCGIDETSGVVAAVQTQTTKK